MATSDKTKDGFNLYKGLKAPHTSRGYKEGDKVVIKIDYDFESLKDIKTYFLGKIGYGPGNNKGFFVFANIMVDFSCSEKEAEIKGGHTWDPSTSPSFFKLFDNHWIIGSPANPEDITLENAQEYLIEIVKIA